MPLMPGCYGFAPSNEEELNKITIGELKPHNATITLVEYDPRWPELFEQQENSTSAAESEASQRGAYRELAK